MHVTSPDIEALYFIIDYSKSESSLFVFTYTFYNGERLERLPLELIKFLILLNYYYCTEIASPSSFTLENYDLSDILADDILLNVQVSSLLHIL